MNHLYGLKVPDPTEDLSLEEAKVLSQFRDAFESKRPADAGDVPLTHQITSTSSLPKCGWRPLDDNTLYRFLCADRDKAGHLHPEVSMKRLLNALQFRRDYHIDEILNVGNESGGGEGELVITPNRSRTDSNISELSACSSSCTITTAGVNVEGTSLMVGTFTDDYAVKVTRSIKVSFKTPPGSILKKQDSFTSETTTTTASTRSTARSTAQQSIVGADPAEPAAPPPALLPPLVTSGSVGPPSTITPEQLEKYQRLRVRVFVGRDRQGNPVLCERLGAFMGSGNAHQFTTEEWVQLYIWDLERHFVEMRQAAIATGKPIEKYVFLGDCNGILKSVLTGGIWGVVPLLKVLARTVEDHYPEIVSHIVVFNIPKVASAVWEVIKKFLDPVTASKVILCSGFPKSLALELMDEDCLPIEYGGNNSVDYPKTAKK